MFRRLIDWLRWLFAATVGATTPEEAAAAAMLHPGDQLGCSAWLKCEPGGIRTHRGFFPLKDGEVVPASVLAAAGWPRTGPVLFRDGAITGLDLLPEAERAEVIRKQLAVEFFPLPKDHVFDSLEDAVAYAIRHAVATDDRVGLMLLYREGRVEKWRRLGEEMNAVADRVPDAHRCPEWNRLCDERIGVWQEMTDDEKRAAAPTYAAVTSTLAGRGRSAPG